MATCILRIEKPNSCSDCPLCYDCCACMADSNIKMDWENFTKEVHPNCPLIDESVAE